MTERSIEKNSLDEVRLVVPRRVVHRSFPNETVVLNLATGKYHGLNPTAGEMLDALSRSGSIADVAEEVAERHGLDRDEVEVDVRDLFEALYERGLIETDREPEREAAAD
jgi:PqqD family protein of HPr-rel-A system